MLKTFHIKSLSIQQQILLMLATISLSVFIAVIFYIGNQFNETTLRDKQRNYYEASILFVDKIISELEHLSITFEKIYNDREDLDERYLKSYLLGKKINVQIINNNFEHLIKLQYRYADPNVDKTIYHVARLLSTFNKSIDKANLKETYETINELRYSLQQLEGLYKNNTYRIQTKIAQNRSTNNINLIVVMLILAVVTFALSFRIFKFIDHALKEQEASDLQRKNLLRAEEAAHIGHWRYYIGENTVSWSDEIFRIHGHKPQAFTVSLEQAIKAYHPEDIDDVSAIIELAVSNKQGFDFRKRIIRPNGEIRHVHSIGYCELNIDGSVHAIFGTFQDITDQEKLEWELKTSQERFELAVRGANAGLWDWDITTNDMWYSPRFKQMLEYQDDEFANIFDSFASHLHPDDAEVTLEKLNNHLNNHESFNVEFRLRNKHGKYRWFNGRGLAIWDESDTPTRMAGSITNIHQKKLAEEALKEATLRAETANRAKSEFLANMSHEIRTPMNGIIGMADILKEGKLSKQQQNQLDLLKKSAESLLTIINDILDFSKVEAGKMEVEPINFNLRVTMEDIAELFGVYAREKGLEILLKFSAGTPENIVADAGRIRQILNNLMSNAIKFTREGHVLIAVDVIKVTADKAQLKFTVSDTGIGIEKSKLMHIFDKFTQADSSTTRKFGGTGLGLAISRQLVQLMGGSMQVESDAGKGAAFTFDIEVGLGQSQPVQDISADLKQIKVAVIDDNSVNLMIMEDLLKSWRIKFDLFSSAEEALEKMRSAADEEKPFNMALIDYQMPKMSGDQLGKTIKADEKLKEIKMIMVTSAAKKGDGKYFKDIGFSAYLVKPVRTTKLLDAIGTVWQLNEDEDYELVTRHSLEEAKARQKHKNREKASEEKDGKKHILLVEDNLINQQVAMAMIKSFDYQISVAENGEIGTEMAFETDYDLILMDIQMPVCDGITATSKIRAIEKSSSRKPYPIIALTAHAMKGDKEKCLEAGMDDHITKPLKKEDLTRIFNKFLDE